MLQVLRYIHNYVLWFSGDACNAHQINRLNIRELNSPSVKLHGIKIKVGQSGRLNYYFCTPLHQPEGTKI